MVPFHIFGVVDTEMSQASSHTECMVMCWFQAVFFVHQVVLMMVMKLIYIFKGALCDKVCQ
jgi:hypothetical protein